MRDRCQRLGDDIKLHLSLLGNFKSSSTFLSVPFYTHTTPQYIYTDPAIMVKLVDRRSEALVVPYVPLLLSESPSAVISMASIDGIQHANKRN